jgi:hypothetical protein
MHESPCYYIGGLIKFRSPLDGGDVMFVRNYLENHENFANYFEAWTVMSRLDEFYEFNEDQQCVSFNLEMVNAPDRVAFYDLVCEAVKKLVF